MNNEELIKLKESLEHAEKDITEHVRGGYNYNHRKIWCVDVKRRNDYVDISELVKVFPKRYRKHLIEKFTDEEVYKIHNDWLHDSVENFLTDIKHGYIVPCEEDKEADQKFEELLKIFNNNKNFADSLGCYGRSGGWFGFDAEPILTAIDDAIREFEYEKDEDFEYLGKEALELYEAGHLVLTLADRYNKSMHFMAELEYWMQEYISEYVEPELQEEKDIAKCKKLASKYGYILAKEIK